MPATLDDLKAHLRDAKFAPLYYLHGEETYFIDLLTAMFEAKVVPEADAVFNKTVLYGNESKADAVISAAKSFPVMAPRRLVVVKEAQQFTKTELAKLVKYFAAPSPLTVLVLAFRGKDGGLGKDALKALEAAKGVDYHAKKLYDKDVKQWAAARIRELGLEAEPGIPDILVANLGTNLGLIDNELQKMAIYLTALKQPKLTKALAYENINVDKDFNVFELVNALAARDRYRAHLIADKLSQNARQHPPVVAVGAIFQLYHRISLIHSRKLAAAEAIQKELGLNYYAAQDALAAAQRHPLPMAYRCLLHVQEADLRLKGLAPTQMDESHIFKTLIWKLLG